MMVSLRKKNIASKIKPCVDNYSIEDLYILIFNDK